MSPLWCVAALMLGLVPALSASAQSYESAGLDRLFAELRAAPDERAAAPVVAQLWQRWMVLDDREQRLLMELGMLQMRTGDLADADATFTRLIGLAPDLPEPWHKRGSIRMLRGELAAATADFCAALRRERRHFGAYSNLGAVRLQMNEPARAIAAFALALRYNPHMPGAQQELDRLGAVADEPPADPLGCGLQTAGR